MFNIINQGSSLLIKSNDNSQFPWNNGEMSIPLNSIYYIIDESDYVAFRSVSNGDILFTALIDEIQINGSNVTKETLPSLFDIVSNAASSGSGGGGSSTAGVISIDGQQGMLTTKTINGQSILGSGEITIESESVDLSNYYNKTEVNDLINNIDVEVTESDPIFEAWKNGNSIAAGNTSNASGENSIAIGVSSQGVAKNTVAIGRNAGANSSGGVAIGNGASSINPAAIALGQGSQGMGSSSIAIGNEAIVPINVIGGLAIGTAIEASNDFPINIKNAIKCDATNYTYVLNEYGNYVRIPTSWTGTQSQYDALGTYYDNVTYNIIEG